MRCNWTILRAALLSCHRSLRMSSHQASARVTLILLTAACDGGTEPTALPTCPQTVTVAVGAGTTPSISWTPRCRAGELIVDPNSDFVDYWVLRSTAASNDLSPPVSYGASPSGTVTLVSPVPLQAGSTYRVRVLLAPGDTTHPFEVVGATFFAP